MSYIESTLVFGFETGNCFVIYTPFVFIYVKFCEKLMESRSQLYVDYP